MEPKLRSTSSKKRMRKSQSGKQIFITKAKKPSHAHCGICGNNLHGTMKRGSYEAAKLSKTQRRPERVFGGVLCGNCTQDVIKEKTRVELGVADKKDFDLRHWKFLDMLKIK